MKKINTYSAQFKVIYPKDHSKIIIRMVFRMRKNYQKIDKNL